MDAREVFRQEKAKRAAAPSAKERQAAERAEFLERFDELRGVIRDKKGKELDSEVTYRALAEKTGLPVSTMNSWTLPENKTSEPSRSDLRAIAKHFTVTTDWLLGIEGAPKRPNQWRTDAKLADDVADYIKTALDLSVTSSPSQAGEQNQWNVYGDRVLQVAVDHALRQARWLVNQGFDPETTVGLTRLDLPGTGAGAKTGARGINIDTLAVESIENLVGESLDVKAQRCHIRATMGHSTEDIAAAERISTNTVNQLLNWRAEYLRQTSRGASVKAKGAKQTKRAPTPRRKP